MKILILFIFCFFAAQVLSAQVIFPEKAKKNADSTLILNKLNVNQDERLDKMLNWHIQMNKKKDGIDGFRVEIYFSSGFDARENAENKKAEFLSEYPDYPVYVKYIAPNFRVRVGDFRTKNEALKLYKEITETYPVAFIVSDNIEFPLLKPLNYE